MTTISKKRKADTQLPEVSEQNGEQNVVDAEAERRAAKKVRVAFCLISRQCCWIAVAS